MAGTARIPQLRPQPGQAVIGKLHSPLPGGSGGYLSRLIIGQQLHQGRRQLLGTSAGALAFELMPLAVTDGELS